jgi:hypothetical protein
MTTTMKPSTQSPRTTITVYAAPPRLVTYTGPAVVFIGEGPAPVRKSPIPFPLVRPIAAPAKKMLGIVLPPRGSVATPW